MDLFFDIPASGRKWEAALDGSGTGLVQTSTDRLQGRKLFMWGSGSGGRHWQEFLSAPGRAYLEIQAGLANYPDGTSSYAGRRLLGMAGGIRLYTGGSERFMVTIGSRPIPAWRSSWRKIFPGSGWRKN